MVRTTDPSDDRAPPRLYAAARWCASLGSCMRSRFQRLGPVGNHADRPPFDDRASARRAWAAIDDRFLTAHTESAIRLPPGSRSSIAAYGPISRNDLPSRVFQLSRGRAMERHPVKSMKEWSEDDPLAPVPTDTIRSAGCGNN